MEFDKNEEALREVYIKTLNFISFKKRSTKEVLDKIEKYLIKTHLPLREIDVIREDINKKIKEEGYLKESNDLDLAKYYIESLINSKKTLNKMKIYQFLVKKGVDKEVIEIALEDLDDKDVYNSVLKEAEKKLRTLNTESKHSKRKKLMNFLYRKGYPFEIINSVVDTLM